MRTLITFVALLLVLVVGSYWMLEGFVDGSGNAAPEQKMTLTISELLSLFTKFGRRREYDSDDYPRRRRRWDYDDYDTQTGSGSGSGSGNKPCPTPAPTPAPAPTPTPCPSSAGDAASVDNVILSDGTIDSFMRQQGADFLRFVPGKNPADYVRKDSIPCYGCTL